MSGQALLDAAALTDFSKVQEAAQAGEAGGHATIWSGTAESAIDLHSFLPAGFATSTIAGIDSFGNVYGTAYTADLVSSAFVWRPVPEPASAALALIPLTALASRRRRA